MWSVLCNQAPITIEGGQSSSWTLAGTTLFQAIRLLARFCFKLFTTLDPWLRGMVERLLTLVSAARRHICLPVLGKSDKLMLIVMGKRQIDRFLVEESLRNFDIAQNIRFCCHDTVMKLI